MLLATHARSVDIKGARIAYNRLQQSRAMHQSNKEGLCTMKLAQGTNGSDGRRPQMQGAATYRCIALGPGLAAQISSREPAPQYSLAAVSRAGAEVAAGGAEPVVQLQHLVNVLPWAATSNGSLCWH